jgi:hypothetical protein
VDPGSAEGYFSSNLESIQKDIKCTFGILEKRWRILHNGIHFCNIKKCKKMYVACCCLHNFLVDIMETNVPQIGRGRPMDNDNRLWLEGPTQDNP